MRIVEFSPGSTSLVERSLPTADWGDQLYIFTLWLACLKRELEAAGHRKALSRTDRVRLIHLVNDILPPPTLDEFGGEVGGSGGHHLVDLLQRHLARLSLGEGTPQEVLQQFILAAPEGEVLTLIEMTPQARMIADSDEQRSRSPFASPESQGDPGSLSRIRDSLNDYLASVSWPARFSSQGEFRKDAYAIEAPLVLSKLPKREDLIRDLETFLRDKRVVALVFIDLDGFKSVNDTLGHQAGDRCLERVADILGTIAKDRGRVYRYGGDEFAVVLPNAFTPEAATTGERIRSTVEESGPGGNVRVTASIGVACSDSSLFAQLIEAADKAVYASKSAGKNRVTTWPLGVHP